MPATRISDHVWFLLCENKFVPPTKVKLLSASCPTKRQFLARTQPARVSLSFLSFSVKSLFVACVLNLSCDNWEHLWQCLPSTLFVATSHHLGYVSNVSQSHLQPNVWPISLRTDTFRLPPVQPLLPRVLHHLSSTLVLSYVIYTSASKTSLLQLPLLRPFTPTCLSYLTAVNLIYSCTRF